MAPRLYHNANVVSTTPYDGITEIGNESFLGNQRFPFKIQEPFYYDLICFVGET